MIHDVDVGRRVIQCACERTAAWHGAETAHLQGWRPSWVRSRTGTLRRAWRCPDCEAARPKPRRQRGGLPQSSFKMPMPDLGTAMTQPARALALLDEHLESDPEAVAEFFVELFRRRGLFLPHVIGFWESRARARGFEPPPRPKRKRGRRRQEAAVT